MEEKRGARNCDISPDSNLMEENKEKITDIICKTRSLIESTLYQHQICNGNSFNDRFYSNLHKIIIGESVMLMMLSGIYDSDVNEEEKLEEILGDYNASGDEMLEESLDCISGHLLKRGIL